MKKPYHIINRENAAAAEKLQEFARANGQYLLPLVDLITEVRIAVDEVVEQAGRSLIETILQLSAQQIAGERTPGKAAEKFAGTAGKAGA